MLPNLIRFLVYYRFWSSNLLKAANSPVGSTNPVEGCWFVLALKQKQPPFSHQNGQKGTCIRKENCWFFKFLVFQINTQDEWLGCCCDILWLAHDFYYVITWHSCFCTFILSYLSQSKATKSKDLNNLKQELEIDDHKIPIAELYRRHNVNPDTVSI